MDNFTKLKEMLTDIIEKYSKKVNNISVKIDDISGEISQNESNIDDLQIEITETEETIKKMRKYKKLQEKCNSYVIPFFGGLSAMICSLPFFLEGTLDISQIFSPKYAMIGLAELLLTSYCVVISNYYRKLNKDLIKPYTLDEEIDNLANLYEKKASEERILGNNIIYKNHLTTQLEDIDKEKGIFENYLAELTNGEFLKITDYNLRNQHYQDVMKLVRTKQQNVENK